MLKAVKTTLRRFRQILFKNDIRLLDKGLKTKIHSVYTKKEYWSYVLRLLILRLFQYFLKF